MSETPQLVVLVAANLEQVKEAFLKAGTSMVVLAESMKVFVRSFHRKPELKKRFPHCVVCPAFNDSRIVCTCVRNPKWWR